MVKSSDPNYHHDFHNPDKVTSISPPFTSIFPVEFETFETYEGKVLEVIKTIGDKHGDCRRDWIVQILKGHMTYGQIHTAIGGLRDKSLIHRSRSKCWKFGKKIELIGGTHGSGPSKLGVELSHLEEGFRLLTKMPYIHNVQGYVDVKYWGELEPSKFREKEYTKDLGNGAYIKLIQQGFSLQLYLANKRPGYDLKHLLKCFRDLDDYLFKLGIQGEIVIESFEMREQQYGVIADLKHNPIEIIILEDYIIRIYQEDNKINKEIRILNFNGTRAEVVEMIINIDYALTPMILSNKIKDSVDRIGLEIQATNKIILKKQEHIREVQSNEYAEVMEQRINTANALEQIEDVALVTDKVNGTLEKIEVQVNGLQTSVSEIEKNGGGLTSKIENKVDKQNEIIETQNLILDKLTDKVIEIQEFQELNLDVIKKDLAAIKKQNPDESIWSVISEDDRIQFIESIRSIPELKISWEKVGKLLEQSGGNIFRYYGRRKSSKQRLINEDNELTSKNNDLLNKKIVDLSNQILEFIKNNPDCQTKNILDNVRRKRSHVKKILDDLFDDDKIENSGKFGKGYSWRIK